ncbi:hypothetical protein BGY98DRAFT_1192780 [Russula aff. rugulosa BPL654]|nr:hypothetical protein BGY98DRAFT_1192780 [Russula aff. rugulosa BPL654]
MTHIALVVEDFSWPSPGYYPMLVIQPIFRDGLNRLTAPRPSSLAITSVRFRWNSNILAAVIKQTFRTLVTLATNLLNSPPAGAELAIPVILHLIELILIDCTGFIDASTERGESPDIVPTDEEERERSEWWKAKKWVCWILVRLFHRFGNPSQLPSPLQDEYGPFADRFVKAFAPEIFKVCLHQIELYASGQAWLSKKCQVQILQFFMEWFPRSTWAWLKPHFQSLVSNFVFPNLYFTPARRELWQSDPIDYTRTSIGTFP